jgi:hypothetical protein
MVNLLTAAPTMGVENIQLRGNALPENKKFFFSGSHHGCDSLFDLSRPQAEAENEI